ncbi:MAG: SulP family inorganic anion transporter [Saprospiraceae bacterium]|jgi:SulP family sulfate permease|nr:SulP family inorganic anion transporter [Saprospiraceae bacterium]
MLKIKSGDLFGGLTAGIVALPLALAFGVQSGLGAAYGLYGAIFLGFFAALLGGTPSQISGPTGPMTVVTAALLAQLLANGATFEDKAGAIVLTFFLAGILQILMGLLKLGSLIKYIPYPVISGFMSGIGVIIILLQIYPAFGLSSPSSTIGFFENIGTLLTSANLAAVGLSAFTILIIYLFPRLTKKVPSVLVALLAGTLLSLVMSDLPRIGHIPKGFPAFLGSGIFSIEPSALWIILEMAATLAALGAVDSLLTSVVADNVTKTKHSSNKELIGQGIGNAVGGLFGAIPGAGATMRTLVNIRAGGITRLSGIIHALVLLAILLGLGQFAEFIPKAVLAGILITVGIGILDYKGIAHIQKVPRSDAIIMMAVLLLTVFVDLLIAVGIGMLLASILFMKKMSDLAEESARIDSIESLQKALPWDDENLPPDVAGHVMVEHLEGPLFFGFSNRFQNLSNGMAAGKYLIIRMERVPYIDQSGLYALEEVILDMERRHIDVLITGLQTQPRDRLERVKIIPDLVEKKHLFQQFSDCINWLKINFQHQIA